VEKNEIFIVFDVRTVEAKAKGKESKRGSTGSTHHDNKSNAMHLKKDTLFKVYLSTLSFLLLFLFYFLLLLCFLLLLFLFYFAFFFFSFSIPFSFSSSYSLLFSFLLLLLLLLLFLISLAHGIDTRLTYVQS